MRLLLAAACALLVPSALPAQTQPAPPDLSNATPIAGSWSYTTTATGTEAIFSNPSAMPQMMVTCIRVTRHVLVAKTAKVAAPFMAIWTSAMTRSIPSSFNPLTSRLSVDLATYDPLLDALAFSRGRIGVSVSGTPSLVVPAQPEVARVIEDCRS